MPPIASPDRLRLGGFVLDPSRAQLEGADGQPVELRAQAFAVLQHLAANAGRVVTKDELFAAVWPGVVVTDDSLVQAIGDIRRVLGPAGHRSIRTLPRRGYTLVPDEAPAAPAEPVGTPPPAARSSEPDAAAGPKNRTSRRRLVLAAGGLFGAALAATGAAWRWRTDAASARRHAVAVPAAPTIAVLPFDSGSATDQRPWIGAGLQIGITSALARISGLPVLWNPTTPPTPSASASGADNRPTHWLSGSVQSDAPRVRVTVQLSEAGSGRVVWSERYERPLNELFALEDEIIAKTVLALQVKLVEGEQARSRAHPKGNLKAWELATRGYVQIEISGPGPLAEARALFEQALALDADYAWARAYLAATCFLEARFRFVPDPAASMQRAFDEASRAVRTDPGLPDAHSTLGSVLLARRQFDEALKAGRHAVALGPNQAEIHAVLAQTMLATGHWQDAVALSQKAIRLASRPPSWFLVPQSYGLVYLGRFGEAIAAGERMSVLAESPFQRRGALGAIAFAQVEAGRIDEARRTVAEMLPMAPGRGASAAGAALLFEDPRNADRLARALQAAGMPA